MDNNGSFHILALIAGVAIIALFIPVFMSGGSPFSSGLDLTDKAYKTIFNNTGVSPQYNVTADTADDSLQIVGSGNISVVTDFANDRITIIGTGGSDTTSASNLGSGSGWFAQEVGDVLEFKSATSAGDGIVLTPDSNTIQFSLNNIPKSEISLTGTWVDADLPSDVVYTGDSQTLTLKAIDADGNTITDIDDNEIKAAAGIAWSKISKSGSILNDIGSPTSSYSFNTQRLTSLGTPSASTDAQRVDKLGLQNVVPGECTNGAPLEYQTSNSTWICGVDSGAGSAITSINGDATAAQIFSGTAGNVTITDTGSGTLQFNTGDDVVVTGGNAQTITKGVTLNSLTLGGSENANSQRITSLGIPSASTDAQRVDKLGLQSVVTSACADGAPLEYQTSNSTWICGIDGGAGGGIASINGDSTSAQIFSGVGGNVTITDTGAGTLEFNLGTNVVMTTGTQTVTGKSMSGSSNTFSDIPKSAISSTGTFPWTEISKSGSSIHDLGNVTSTGCAAGEILKVSGTNWICSADSGITSAVTSLNGDSAASQTISGTTGNVTVTDTGAGALQLDIGPNVVVTTGAQTITGKTMDADDNTFSDIDDNEIKTAAGIAWSKISKTGSSIHDISNVTSTGCASGQILKVSGTTWQCAADGGSGINTINSDSTTAQVFSGSANELTLDDSGAGTIVFDVGTDIVQIDQGNTYTGTNAQALGTSYFTFGADPADAGQIRLSNTGSIAWEADAAGTDIDISVDSSEDFVFGTGANNINFGSNPAINLTIDEDGTGNSITNLANANIKASAGIDTSKLADSANFVLKNTAQTYDDGIKLTFNPSTTNAGVNVGAVDTAPSSPIEGDVFVEGDADKIWAYLGTSWVDLGTGGGGGALDDVYLDGVIVSNSRAIINFNDTSVINFNVDDDSGLGMANVSAGIVSGSIGNTELGTGIDAVQIGGGGVTSSEFDFLADVTSLIQAQFTGKQTTTLTDGNILVGSSGNLATSVNPTGAVDISNTGVFSIANIHSIGNVTSTGCASGEILKVSGTTWECAADAGGGITSINSDSTAAQVFSGSANELTLDDSGTGTIVFDVGTDIVQIDQANTYSGTNAQAFGTSFLTFNADPADAGYLRFPNAGQACWEASAAGTDQCVGNNASEDFVFDAGWNNIDHGSNPTVNAIIRADGTGNSISADPRIAVLTAGGATLQATASPVKTTIDGTNMDYVTLDFDTTTAETAIWNWEIPEDADTSQDIVAVVSFQVTSGTAGVCFDGSFLGRTAGETVDAAFGTVIGGCDSSTGTNTVETATLTFTSGQHGLAANDKVFFKLARDVADAGDTNASDAKLISVKVSWS